MSKKPDNITVLKTARIYNATHHQYWWEVHNMNTACGLEGITIAYEEEDGETQSSIDVEDDVAVEIALTILEFVNQRRSPENQVTYP